MINKFTFGKLINPLIAEEGSGFGGNTSNEPTGECSLTAQNCGPGFVCQLVSTTNAFGVTTNVTKCVAVEKDDTSNVCQPAGTFLGCSGTEDIGIFSAGQQPDGGCLNEERRTSRCQSTTATPTPTPTTSIPSGECDIIGPRTCPAGYICTVVDSSSGGLGFAPPGLTFSTRCVEFILPPTPTPTPTPVDVPTPTPTAVSTPTPVTCGGNTFGECPSGQQCRELIPSANAPSAYICEPIATCIPSFIKCDGMDGVYYSGAKNPDGTCAIVTIIEDTVCISPTPTPTPTPITTPTPTPTPTPTFTAPVCEKTYSCDGTTAIEFDGTISDSGVLCNSKRIPNDARCITRECSCNPFQYGAIGDSYEATCNSNQINQFNVDCNGIIHQSTTGQTTCDNPFTGYFSVDGTSFYYESGVVRNRYECRPPSTPTPTPTPPPLTPVPTPTVPPVATPTPPRPATPTPTPLPPLPPTPTPTPIPTWRSCIDGTLKPVPVPLQYKSSRYLNGEVCWEPVTIISFEPDLRTALNFIYNRGSEQYPNALSIKAVNPSYATPFEVTFETNSEVSIVPNAFTVSPRSSTMFSLNVTPPLYDKLGDGDSVLNLNVDIREI